MKATLFVVENDADLTQAKALIEKLMGSNDPADLARMTAQARLIEAYERVRWPRRAPSLPDLLTYLMDQHGLSRVDLVPLLGTPSHDMQLQSVVQIRHCKYRQHKCPPPVVDSKALEAGLTRQVIKRLIKRAVMECRARVTVLFLELWVGRFPGGPLFSEDRLE